MPAPTFNKVNPDTIYGIIAEGNMQAFTDKMHADPNFLSIVYENGFATFLAKIITRNSSFTFDVNHVMMFGHIVNFVKAPGFKGDVYKMKDVVYMLAEKSAAAARTILEDLNVTEETFGKWFSINDLAKYVEKRQFAMAEMICICHPDAKFAHYEYILSASGETGSDYGAALKSWMEAPMVGRCKSYLKVRAGD
jgi:hypothetical protein